MKRIISDIFLIDETAVRQDLDQQLLAAGAKPNYDGVGGFFLNDVQITVVTTGNAVGSTMVEVSISDDDAAERHASSLPKSKTRDDLQKLEKKASSGLAKAGRGFQGISGVISLVVAIAGALLIWRYSWVVALIVGVVFVLVAISQFADAAGPGDKIEELKKKIAAEDAATASKISDYRRQLSDEITSAADMITSVFKKMHFKYDRPSAQQSPKQPG